MEIDAVASKRKPQAANTADNPAQFTEQQNNAQNPTPSGTSSEKRQRLATAAVAAAAVSGGGGGEVTSSLLTLPLQSNEASMEMQRLPSEELEELEEGAALQAMLQPQPPAAQPVDDEGWPYEPRSHALLADELTALQLEGGAVSSAPMDADPGGPATAEPNLYPHPEVLAAHPGDPDHRQQHGSDVLIRDLAAQDAGPIQMLSLESLDKNPLLTQFQQQRLLATHMQQAAKAVAAAAALRQQLKGTTDEQMEQVAQEDEVLLLS